ncbi:OmpA family protein [Inquilinus limosus]|uniref:OmpA family protein n=1 Tax=Inquilinus limosus TaxID=171674 RepID=UPI00042926E8|nr:OmpA family protein [Inquilinus limosus]
MRRTGSFPIAPARPGLPARGAVTAAVLGLALAGCGGRIFDSTPYAGDVQASVPAAQTAEVTPLGPAEPAPVPSVGGPLGAPQSADARTYTLPALAQTDADRAAMQQARAQQQAAQQQRRAQIEQQRQAAFQRQQQMAQQQAAAQQAQQQQPTGTVAPLSFGQRRDTQAPAAMEAMPRPASPQSYPNLGNVPEKPTDLPTPEQQAEVRSQLEADRAASGAPGALSFGSRTAGQQAAAPAPAEESKPAFSFNNRLAGSVKFEGGSTALPASANSTIENIAKTAQSPKLRVVGYGAGDGAAQAKARAEAVAAALRAAGVDPARIVTGGSADTRPNITDGQAARVEIYLAN